MEPWERGPGPDLSGGDIGVRFALLLVACAGIGLGTVILVFSGFFPLLFLWLRTPRTGRAAGAGAPPGLSREQRA